MHPFVKKDFEDSQLVNRSSTMDSSKSVVPVTKSYMKDLNFRDDDHSGGYTEQLSDLKPIWHTNSSEDMCQIFDKDAFPGVGSSFNPMSEPFDEWPLKSDAHPEHVRTSLNNLVESSTGESEFTFPSKPTCEDDDDEVIEWKIRAFLDEKVLDLKKLQTPLYEEFFNSLSAIPEAFDRNAQDEYGEGKTELPSKNFKPFSSKIASDSLTKCADNATTGSPRVLNTGLENNPVLGEISPAQLNEWEGLHQDSPPEANNPRHKKWKEELDKELERQREIRQANGVGKFSPLHRYASRKQDRILFMSPRK